MNIWTALAARMTRTWVGAYTTGLAANDREMRRAEIASDVWEHRHDAADEGARDPVIGLGIISRMLRGVPADLFWRARLEGPKMDIRIPFERVAGALMLSLVLLSLITGGVSGYDTSANGFSDELRRLADLGAWSDNGNAFFRIATGLALMGAAAGFYVSLRERSPVLATIAAFGLMTAAILELVASGLQMVLVQLAEEYVSASRSDQPQLLNNARTIALVVQQTIGVAVVALLVSVYALALLAGRERLVPRWLIGLPIMSAALFAGGIILSVGDWDTNDNAWLVGMAGVMMGLLWLLISGLWLLFTPSGETARAGSLQRSA